MVTEDPDAAPSAVLDDEETERLARHVQENAAELRVLLEKLLAVQALAEDLAPGLQDAARENRSDIEALRMAFEDEETLVLLRRLGDDADTLVELLDALVVAQEVTEDLLPELLVVVRENRAEVERLRAAFEREETVVLLERLGENAETLTELLELTDAATDLAADLVPEVVEVAQENRGDIENLRLVAAGFADSQGDRDLDYYQLGQHAGNLLSLSETAGDPAVAATLEDALEAFGDDDPEPVGLFGLLGALRDAEVKRGLGRLVEVLRRLGRQ